MFRRIALVVFLFFTVLAVVVALKNDRKVTTSSSEAYDHYKSGVEFTEDFYFRQAQEEFEQAIKLDTNFAMAQARLASVYLTRGFTKKSKEMQALAYSNRPNVSHREQLQLDIFKAQWDNQKEQAYKLAQDFVQQFPDDYEAINLMALQEYADENFEKSSELFQKVISLQPDYAPAYNMLGYLNYYLGRYEDALAMLDKYIELSRDQANPHDSRGEILHALGRYDEAISEFRQAFNINPEFDFAALHMAQSYQALGQSDQADYCYQILLNQAPSDNKARQYYSSWASLMIVRENYDSARALASKIIAMTNEEEQNSVADAARLMGNIYYRQRNLDSLKVQWAASREALDKEIQKNAHLADDRSFLQSRRFMDATEADLEGRREDALRIFAEMVSSSTTPDEKMSYRIYYSDVLSRSGALAQAVSELQKNLSINPNHPRTLSRLGDVYEAAGDHPSALAYRERLADVWKNADPDFTPLADLRAKMGNSSLASSSRSAVTPAAPAGIN